jgi:hypothetical protein
VSTPHPDPERLALAALPAEPDDPAVTAHLRGCAQCRTEVADLRWTVELVREGGVGDPLPAPPPRVWQAIAAELSLPGGPNGRTAGAVAHHTDEPRAVRLRGPDAGPAAANGASDTPHVTTPRRSPARRRPAARRRGIPVALVAAAVGLVVGLGAGRALAPDPPPPPAVRLVGQLTSVTELDPAASGTVTMADAAGQRQMVVQVRGVTNLAGGDHLEAWLMDPTGTRLVPLGALVGRAGEFQATFVVPDDLPLEEFGRVDVSAERWDGDPGHSSRSLVRGSL